MRRPASDRRTAAEWVTLALSVVVVGTLVFVALREEALRDEANGGNLEITFDPAQTEARGEFFYVPYTIVNTGSRAIASAEIWIDIFAGERLVGSAEIRVQFLPLRGTQSGVFVTPFDPETHTVQGRLESMQFP
jgi:uncharacterized protein (TIGR02588 family)